MHWTEEEKFTLTGILKPLKLFEEKYRLKDCPRSDKPSLRKGRVVPVQGLMEDMAAESSTLSSSAREIGKILVIPESSTRRILHGIFAFVFLQIAVAA